MPLYRGTRYVLLGGAVAAPEEEAGEWQETFITTLNSDSADFQPYNIRHLFPAANLSVSGGKVRITFESGSASTFTITGCYIGHVDPGGGGGAPNFDGSQVRLTFDGGSNGAVLTAGGTKLSDEITYALDETKDFIVAMYLNGGAGTGVHRQNFATGVGTRYFKNTATDETPDTTATGYSNGGAVTTAVNKLEVFA